MLRLGVLGCGRVFERFHLPAISRVSAVDLVAAWDVDPERLRRVALGAPRLSASSSLDALLASDVEAVLILTPPATHPELSLSALEAGKHVLVEKPMALTASDGRRMADGARHAHRVLQVGFTRRFREPYRRLRTALERAGPDRVRAAHFELTFSTAGWNAYSDFLGDEKRGGGVFDDVLSHQVDLLCWLLKGTPETVSVENVRSGAVRAVLRFAGLPVRCDAGHGRYADRLTVELAGRRVLEATGNRFRRTGAALPTLRRRRALLMDRVALLGDRLHRRPSVSIRSFEDQLRDFEQAVRGGPAAGATAEEGINVLRVLEACRASAKIGGRWIAPA
jgi:predicted dehydrogenase